jgi:hypothetical protein
MHVQRNACAVECAPKGIAQGKHLTENAPVDCSLLLIVNL